MASYIQGYDEERFENEVNQNFFCQICFNVFKEPVVCRINQHCFCRSCITKHLENSQTCPTCNDELTVETLAEAPRMVKNLINELKIRCVYIDRGCPEVVQLQHLDSHEDACGFTPAVCTNQDCGLIVNKRDQIHHESEVCKFRMLKCYSCKEITKTLAGMEERIANIEKNNATIEIKITDLVKNAAGSVEKNIADLKVDMEGKNEAVNNEVKGLRTALVEAFNEMKDVLVTTRDKTKENTRTVRNIPSGDKENIIVAGGVGTKSVEMFNWRQRAWLPLQSMPRKYERATSFVYSGHMIIAGGCCGGFDIVDDMIRMKIDPNPGLSNHWNNCPVKLPDKLADHSSVLYDDHLIVTGGENENDTTDLIKAAQLVPPYSVKTLSRMPEPRQGHSMEIFDDNVLIVGGSTTDSYSSNLSSVVLYDIKKNELKELSPLPYEVSDMATVRWGDNIIVIGGADKHGKPLDTICIYNVKTGQSHMLPSMRCKRYGCSAVVIENNIVVLGGSNEQGRQKSVECFNFERYSWEELPEMSAERSLHTAVVV